MNLHDNLVCETCKNLISKPEEGWLQWQDNGKWQTDTDLRYYGFKIVHHKTFSPLKKIKLGACYPYKNDAKLNDLPLDWFIGHDGMGFLMNKFFRKSSMGMYQLVSFKEANDLFLKLYSVPFFIGKS